jgi:hypothetical protein
VPMLLPKTVADTSNPAETNAPRGLPRDGLVVEVRVTLGVAVFSFVVRLKENFTNSTTQYSRLTLLGVGPASK